MKRECLSIFLLLGIQSAQALQCGYPPVEPGFTASAVAKGYRVCAIELPKLKSQNLPNSGESKSKLFEDNIQDIAKQGEAIQAETTKNVNSLTNVRQKVAAKVLENASEINRAFQDEDYFQDGMPNVSNSVSAIRECAIRDVEHYESSPLMIDQLPEFRCVSSNMLGFQLNPTGEERIRLAYALAKSLNDEETLLLVSLFLCTKDSSLKRYEIRQAKTLWDAAAILTVFGPKNRSVSLNATIIQKIILNGMGASVNWNVDDLWSKCTARIQELKR